MVERNKFTNLKMTGWVSLFVFISTVYADTDDESDILRMLIVKIDTMQAKIGKLEKSEANWKQSIGALIGTTAQFRLQFADMTKKLAAYEKSDKEKAERIKNLENELLKNSETDGVVHKEISENERCTKKKLSNKMEEHHVKKGIRQTPEQVAFSAYLDHVTRNIGKEQTIVYNVVLLNEAGAYSEKTGIFRVPVSGVYLFSWSITARKLHGEPQYDIWVKLVVNGVHKVDAVAESRSDVEDNQGSNVYNKVMKCGRRRVVVTRYMALMEKDQRLLLVFYCILVKFFVFFFFQD